MLKGLSVCAYQPEITVFDESSVHYNKLILNYENPKGLTGIHKLIQDREKMTLRPTRLNATDKDVEAIRQFHQEKYGDSIANSAWMKKFFRSKEAQGKDVQSLPFDKQKEYFEKYKAQMSVIDHESSKVKSKGKQEKGQQDQSGLDERLQEVRGSFASYIRTKLVFVFDAEKGTFALGSLANYTDNQTIHGMVTFLHSIKGPTKVMLSI